MNRFIFGSLAILALATAHGARAATESSNIGASASVSTVCSLDSTPLAFGEVALSGATPVTVNCTGGGAYTVGLGNGLHNVAAQRNLVSSANVLAYELYKQVGHTLGDRCDHHPHLHPRPRPHRWPRSGAGHR